MSTADEPLPPTQDEEEILVAYVERGLALRDAGQDIDVQALCSDHPDLAPAVAEALGLTGVLPRVPDASDPLVGRVLADRYQLQRCIGIGGMGAVYEARDVSLQRQVAVKILQPGFFRTEERAQRFVREARVLAALQHDNVVPIHDHGAADDGLHFLVMDLVAGTSLASILQEAVSQEQLPPGTDWLGVRVPESSYLRQVARWGVDLARGLAEAHAQGVFHRDVKPSNVIITTQGRAVLLDFGIAAIEGDASLTDAGTALGTPWYMAPEQAMPGKSPEVTRSRPAAIDVYGLCATLYHLLTLRPPFDGEPTEVLVKLVTEAPPPPQRLQPRLPKDLCAILEKGMERFLRHRYQDMQALQQDLQAFLDHAPVTARPLTPLARTWRRLRRRPARSLAVAGITVSLVLAAALIPLWSSVRAAEQGREYEQLVSTLPALLSIEAYPHLRLLQDQEERGRSLGQLNRILELRPDDVASRLLRAALLLDQGNHAAARQDLQAIADQNASPYLRGVVACYAKADSSKKGVEAVLLADLPDPENDVDCFVAGFHELRARTDIARAHELLSRAAGSYVPARDLRLLAGLFLGTRERDPKKKRDQNLAVIQEALALEGIYGRKTARTRHAIGTALIGLRDYLAAEKPLQEALALRPNRHGPLHNLGIVYRRLRQLDRAEEYLQKAHELRPWLWNTLYTLAQVKWDRGRFDEALALAERVPKEGTMGEAWRRPYLIGCVHLNAAFHDVRSEKHDEARRRAARAQVQFELSARNGGPARLTAVHKQIAVAIQQDIKDEAAAAAAAALLQVLGLDPSNPEQINNLALVLPAEGLSPELVELLRRYLMALAVDLAPGDPEPRRQLQRLQQQKRR